MRSVSRKDRIATVRMPIRIFNQIHGCVGATIQARVPYEWFFFVEPQPALDDAIDEPDERREADAEAHEKRNRDDADGAPQTR